MVKLKDYLPSYFDKTYEMQVLMEAEQTQFDKFDDLIIKNLMNQFVLQSDIQGLKIFEDQLGIEANPTESIETRRYNILMRMLPPKPITLKYFRELLHTLDIPASVNVNYAIRNVIAKAKEIDINRDQIKRLKYLLNVYLPANLTHNIIVTAEVNSYWKMYFGIATLTKISTTSNPRLKTYSDSKTNIYQGSIRPQILVKTTSRALIKNSAKTSTKQYRGSFRPQIFTKISKGGN